MPALHGGALAHWDVADPAVQPVAEIAVEYRLTVLEIRHGGIVEHLQAQHARGVVVDRVAVLHGLVAHNVEHAYDCTKSRRGREDRRPARGCAQAAPGEEEW